VAIAGPAVAIVMTPAVRATLTARLTFNATPFKKICPLEIYIKSDSDQRIVLMVKITALNVSIPFQGGFVAGRKGVSWSTSEPA
jgi:hypothetical protein